MIVSKIYLTEEEFDNENFEVQREYRYCKQCGIFYHYPSIGDRCGHPFGYFTVQSDRDKFMEQYEKLRGEL